MQLLEEEMHIQENFQEIVFEKLPDTFSKRNTGIPSPRNKMDNIIKLPKTTSQECLTEMANYR